MAEHQGQGIFKTAGLEPCSQWPVVRTYQKWSEEGQPVNQQQVRVWSGGWSVWSDPKKSYCSANCWKGNAGYDRKLSMYTMHRGLLHLEVHNRRPVRVLKLTPVRCQKCLQWAREHRNWSNGRKKLDLMNPIFFYIMRMSRSVCIAYLGRSSMEALWEEGKQVLAVWCCKILLGNLESWHFCACYFNNVPKHCCTCIFGNLIP